MRINSHIPGISNVDTEGPAHKFKSNLTSIAEDSTGEKVGAALPKINTARDIAQAAKYNAIAAEFYVQNVVRSAAGRKDDQFLNTKESTIRDVKILSVEEARQYRKERASKGGFKPSFEIPTLGRSMLRTPTSGDSVNSSSSFDEEEEDQF